MATTSTKRKGAPLSEKELMLMNGYWRAANYLSIGQIYLLDNPLLKETLKKEHIKPRFTKDKPIIFAYHGYPWLIHRLTYRRCNHKNLHVRGYKEEAITTPFDLLVMNDLDRFGSRCDRPRP